VAVPAAVSVDEDFAEISTDAGSADYNQYYDDTEIVAESVGAALDTASQVVMVTAPETIISYAGIGISFFIGSLVAVGLYLLVDYIRFRK